MKSKNLILQKVTIIVALIALGLVLLSSLGFVQEDWIVLLYRGLRNPRGNNNFFGQCLEWESVVFSDSKAVEFYYNIWDNIQSANNAIFYTSVIGFVLIAVACITGNYGRRRFYISNLVSGLLFSVVEFIMAIVSIAKCSVVIKDMKTATPDFEVYYNLTVAKYEEYHQATDELKVINSNHVYLNIVIMAIFAILTICFAVSTVYKFKKTYVKVEKNEIEKEESNETLGVKIDTVKEAK
ncbi:MAG: hypothetical protein K6G28_03800 [Acholeplasmatales bacterium]|nr:hypothetical protein [Acholeplasmatales bacterium]